jgi:hypothetical protein
MILDIFSFYYYIFVRFYYLLNLIIFDLKYTYFIYLVLYFIIIFFIFFIVFTIFYYKIVNNLLINEKINYRNFTSGFLLIIFLPFFYDLTIELNLVTWFRYSLFLLIFLYLFSLIVYDTNIIIKFFKDIYNFLFFKKKKDIISFSWNTFEQLYIEKIETRKSVTFEIDDRLHKKFELTPKSKMYKNFEELFKLSKDEYFLIFSILKYFPHFQIFTLLELKKICDYFLKLKLEYHNNYFKKSKTFATYSVPLCFFLVFFIKVLKRCLLQNYFCAENLDFMLNNFLNFNVSLLYIELLVKFVFLFFSIVIVILHFFLVFLVISYITLTLYWYYYRNLVNNEFKNMVLKDYEQNKLDSFLEIKKLYKNRQNALEVYWIKNSVYLPDKFYFLNEFNQMVLNIKEKDNDKFEEVYKSNLLANKKLLNFTNTFFSKSTTLKNIFSFYFLDENNIIKNNKYLKKRKIDKIKFIKQYGLTDVEAFDYHFNPLFYFRSSSFKIFGDLASQVSVIQKNDVVPVFLKHAVPDFFDLLNKNVEKDFKKFSVGEGVIMYGFLGFIFGDLWGYYSRLQNKW